MDNDKLNTGLTIISEPEINPELTELQREYALDKVKSDIALENRRKAVMVEAIQTINRFEPVKITDEMVELGLEDEIRSLVQQADSAYKFYKMFLGDDADDFTSNPYQSYLGL